MSSKPSVPMLVGRRSNISLAAHQLALTRHFGFGDASAYDGISRDTVRSGFQAPDISERVQQLFTPPSPASMLAVSHATVGASKSLQEELFDAVAAVKILTSQVAMHLEQEWRERLFKQVDRLHEIDEWDEDDRPLQTASFATFLKAICDLKPLVRPGLGLSGNGHLVAAWTTGKDRLTLQFLPKDRVKWVISRYVDDELEQVAGDTPVARLSEALRPYRPNYWFSPDERRSTTVG